MALLSYEFFEPRVKETFTASVGDVAIDMTLAEVKRGRPRPPTEGIRTEPFALYFKCGAEAWPQQGLYKFANAAIGDVEIFIVPVAREADGILYEAVFN